MSCKKISLKLNAYLDKELDPVSLSQVREHLKSCINCQNELRELITLNRVLGSIKSDMLPGNLESILSTQHKQSTFSIIPRKRISWISLAASIVLSFFLGSYLSNTAFSNTKQTTTQTYTQESLYSYLDGAEND